jgi:hypothetical protein
VRQLLLLTLGAALLSVPVPAALARVELERVDRPSTADAAAGMEAWVGERGVLRLRPRGGAVSTAPVGGGINPLHLDVGTDAAGKPLVAYARCDAKGLHCNLFTYDPAARSERRLQSAVNTAAEEGYPSVYGGRIAFARWSSRVATQPGKPRLYVSLLRGLPVREPTGGGVVGLTWTELSERGLFVGALYPADFRDQRMLRLVEGKIIRIDRATSGGANAANMTKPSVGSRHVYYARTNRGSGTGNRYFRIDLTTGEREEARGSATTQSAAWLGSAFLVARSSFSGAREGAVIEETDRIRWTPAPPPRRG